MKLILEKHNLKFPSCGKDHTINMGCFPTHIREMARYAETVEYHDKGCAKILKARDRSKEACQMYIVPSRPYYVKCPDIKFAEFSNTKALGFNLSVDPDRPGINS